MSNDEEHAPSAAASENEDDDAEADSDREQPTLATPIITESRYFEEKVKRKGFRKWNDIEKPKKSWQRFKWYNQMGQVGTSGSSGTGRSGSPDLRGPSWVKWVKNKGSVQLNLST